MKVAIDYSDALIKGSEEIPKELEAYLKASNKPVLEYFSLEEFAEPYSEFYNTKVLN
jgi:starch synthase